VKTFWLIGQKFGHFIAVLFLSSFLLAAFLWISPGSPGKPSDPVSWDDVTLGSSKVCVEAVGCGTAAAISFGSAPLEWFRQPGAPKTAMVELDGALVFESADDILLPGPTFTEWFFAGFWGGLLRWDVGQTYAGDEVLDVVVQGSTHTLPIVFVTLALSIVVALLLTALLTWLPFPSLRGAIRAFLLVFSITPVFILAFVLQSRGVLPTGAVTYGILGACVAALAIGDSNLGEMLLHFENEFRALRSRDYIHAARLRGASEFKHMLPGLLLPISSIAAGKVAFLLGAVVIVEFVWGVPGLGDASLRAAEKGDALLLVTLTVLITGVVALVALIRDIIEILIDPRLRRSSEDGG